MLEWSNPNSGPNNKICPHLCCGSGTRSPIYYSPKNVPAPTNPDWSGLDTKATPSPNQQHYIRRRSKWHNSYQQTQVHGPTIPLVTMPWSSEAVSFLLGQRTQKLGRLQHQAPPTSVPLIQTHTVFRCCSKVIQPISETITGMIVFHCVQNGKYICILHNLFLELFISFQQGCFDTP